ncbi:hypothetical protein ON010_g15260 [Phytophthora cinnamomi]|nr:hypothetical protein ON010_g15260 [Phytophthora cinnamomi]
MPPPPSRLPAWTLRSPIRHHPVSNEASDRADLTARPRGIGPTPTALSLTTTSRRRCNTLRTAVGVFGIQQRRSILARRTLEPGPSHASYDRRRARERQRGKEPARRRREAKPSAVGAAKGRKSAATRDRTRDLQIFSLTLSQLSYRGAKSQTCPHHTKFCHPARTKRRFPYTHTPPACHRHPPAYPHGHSDPRSDTIPSRTRPPTEPTSPHDHAQHLEIRFARERRAASRLRALDGGVVHDRVHGQQQLQHVDVVGGEEVHGVADGDGGGPQALHHELDGLCRGRGGGDRRVVVRVEEVKTDAVDD